MGAFGEQKEIEPMSTYKWNVLNSVASIHMVKAFIDKARGLEIHPPMLPIPDAGLTRMRNPLLNGRLQRIRQSEPLSDDASIETLNMLDILVQATEATISYGLSYGNIVKTGLYLRSDGDKIDYLKLEAWLHKLHIHRMTQLTASILVQTLGFSADEIPFLTIEEKNAWAMALASLDNPLHIDTKEWQTRQLGNGLVETNSRAMAQTARNCMRYFVLAPIESTSCFVSRFADSLANLKE